MNWTIQALAFSSNLFWFVGSKVAGDRRRVGWIILWVSEVIWMALSVAAHLWGIIPWCVFGLILYARNWWLWRHQEPAQPH